MNDCELGREETTERDNLIYQKLFNSYLAGDVNKKRDLLPHLIFLSEDYTTQQLNVGENE